MSDKPPRWFMWTFGFVFNAAMAAFAAVAMFAINVTFLGKSTEDALLGVIVTLVIAYGLTNASGWKDE